MPFLAGCTKGHKISFKLVGVAGYDFEFHDWGVMWDPLFKGKIQAYKNIDARGEYAYIPS